MRGYLIRYWRQIWLEYHDISRQNATIILRECPQKIAHQYSLVMDHDYWPDTSACRAAQPCVHHSRLSVSSRHHQSLVNNTITKRNQRNPYSNYRWSLWEYGSKNKNVIGIEAEIIGKRASHVYFLQLRELFYDQHGDYHDGDSYEILIWEWSIHEVRLMNL
jgi:hypothetical protein